MPRRWLAIQSAIVLLLHTALVQGSTLTVINNSDDGAGSLRAAIAAANSGDTISFDMTSVVSPITLVSGELTISKDLTIAGPGSDRLTISGNHQGRVFFIEPGTTVTLSGLSLTEGSASFGGAILSFCSSLTIRECTLTGNSTSGDINSGGAIVNSSVLADTTLVVVSSTISGNSAGGRYGTGGGIYNDGRFNRGTVAIENSTISGNSATAGGGGIFNDGANGGIATLEIRNSTFSGNSAAFGPGIVVANNNSTDPDLGGLAVLKFTNTIMDSGSSGEFIRKLNDSPGEVVTSFGSNICTASDPYGFFTAPGDLIADPKLGPLQDNGGPTLTHALLPDSPAIDAGNNEYVTSEIDQRGFVRIINGKVDMGAVEYGSTLPIEFGIQKLIAEVNALAVKAAIQNALVVKLNAALKALSLSQSESACDSLGDFIDLCTAQSGKKIPADDAARLIAAANQIRAALNCRM